MRIDRLISGLEKRGRLSKIARVYLRKLGLNLELDDAGKDYNLDSIREQGESRFDYIEGIGKEKEIENRQRSNWSSSLLAEIKNSRRKANGFFPAHNINSRYAISVQAGFGLYSFPDTNEYNRLGDYEEVEVALLNNGQPFNPIHHGDDDLEGIEWPSEYRTGTDVLSNVTWSEVEELLEVLKVLS